MFNANYKDRLPAPDGFDSEDAIDLIHELLKKPGNLSEKEHDAFGDMLERSHLTAGQRGWIFGVAERLGLVVRPTLNAFSNLSPDQQAREKQKAATSTNELRKIQDSRPLKPPGR